MMGMQKLASDIAFLSNNDLQLLAQELVVHYAPRAGALETQLNAAFFYNDIESNKERQYE